MLDRRWRGGFLNALTLLIVAAIGVSVSAQATAPAASSGKIDHEDARMAARESGEPCVKGDECAEDDESLLGDWGGLRPKLAEVGMEYGVWLTNVYQQNMRGGEDTHDARRLTGLYDVELSLDLTKVLHSQGTSVYVFGEGGYGNGLDGAGKIGDWMGINDNVIGYRSMDVLEFWVEQTLIEDRLLLRAGKIDLTGGFECRGCGVSFDSNSYANDGTAQFMNSALVNNPTIPFPEQGLGAILFAEPVDGFYTSLGAADAQADYRKTGFSTAFHDEDYFVFIQESGIVHEFTGANGPLVGAYRVGVWYDPQPKSRYFDDRGGRWPERFRRDDVGAYTSIDQKVYRENSDDDQGLGVFFRYGFAHSDVNTMEHFWSAGAEYRGLIERRDRDVLGVGVAQGVLSDDLRYTGESPGRETAIEMYYSIYLFKGVTLSPDLQYIVDPGGVHVGRDALIAGLRLQMSF
jgi:porin